MKLLFTVDLLFEALTAAALIVVPELVVALVFSPDLPPEFSALGRIAGIALGIFVLGCWMAWRRGRHHALRNALLGYNIFAIGLLIAFGVLYEPIGPLLWPAVAIHVALTVALALVAGRR
jgi:hypothetical protein